VSILDRRAPHPPGPGAIARSCRPPTSSGQAVVAESQGEQRGAKSLALDVQRAVDGLARAGGIPGWSASRYSPANLRNTNQLRRFS